MSREGREGGATPGVHLSLLTVQVFFASFAAVGKIALRELPTVGLAAMRVTLATAVLAAIALLSRRARLSRADLGRLALYSVFGVSANQLLFIAGLQRTSATNAVVLGASIPVFTAAVALALGRERATPLGLGGLAVALCGALALTAGRGIDGSGSALAGNALILVNSFCYAIYLVISRDLLRRVSPLVAMAVVFAFGALFIDAFLFAAGSAHLLSFEPAALLARLPGLSRTTWIALAYIVAFPTVGAYLLIAIALRTVPASLVAIYIYVQPVIGAVLAAALLGERPTWLTVVAAAAIFAGIALTNLDARRTREALVASTSSRLRS